MATDWKAKAERLQKELDSANEQIADYKKHYHDAARQITEAREETEETKKRTSETLERQAMKLRTLTELQASRSRG
jgi:chromosome segregation ATPase